MNLADLRKHSLRTTRTLWNLLILALVATLIVGSAVAGVERDALLPVGVPEENGLSSARLNLLSEFLKAEVERMKTPGATLLVARNGRIVYEDAFGYQDKVTGTPMRKDSLFRIYSMTKPITSLGVMMLLEKGKLLLTDPIERYIPAFKDVKVAVVNEDDSEIVGLESPNRSITIQDLLRQTSGLTYGFFGKRTAVRKAYIAGQAKMRGADLRTAVDRLAELPLIAHPGTRWEYSYSTDVLGRLIEVVSGKKLSTYFKEEIFEPLGMHDTGFYIPEGQLHRAAQGYDPKTGDYPALLTDVTKPPVFESGGGGLVSSMYDYARFCQLILNGGELDGVRLVSRTTVELMSADHLSEKVAPGDLYMPGPGQGFGLGFAVRRSVGVSGFLGSKGEIRWSGMAGTAFWIDPVEQLICIWMIQDVPQSNHYRQRFKNLVYQAIID